MVVVGMEREGRKEGILGPVDASETAVCGASC